jgi:hypothetical protein
MATGEPSAKESPTATAKRKRKKNIRLDDLGEAKPPRRRSRLRNKRSATTSPASGTSIWLPFMIIFSENSLISSFLLGAIFL